MPSAEEVIEVTRQLLVEVGGLDPAEIDPRSQFNDFGLDSVEVLEVVARVEDRYGLKIPEEELSKITTLRELGRYVARHAA
ncbi:MAG: acyl carrier protein [Planctomycetota bacterium]